MAKLKLVRLIVVVFVVLLLVVAVGVGLFADRALKLGIEAAGSKELGVGVKVGKVNLSILKGAVELKNLSIDNPPGYQHSKLLELENGRIEAQIGSLLTDTVNIKDIKLDGVVVVVEQRGITSNNLQDLISRINAGRKKQAQPTGKKLHIDNLEISNITVKVKPLPVPGKLDTITLKLRPIKMTDLGSDRKLDTAALTSKVLVAIAGGVAEQGTGILPDGLVNSVKSELKKAGELTGALIGQGTKILKQGTELGKEVTEGLTGLLRPKKKQDEETGR